MDDMKLGAVEARFADLIWENEPLSSRALSELCERELHWKRPTTYTVLRKLCEKGIFENADGTVRARMTREEFYARRSERFVEDTYGGSLPAFIAAFTARKPLTADEADEIRKLIDDARREGK